MGAIYEPLLGHRRSQEFVFAGVQARRQRRRDRYAEGVEGVRVREGSVPLPSRLLGLGERRKLPSGVRGGDPAETSFGVLRA